MKLGLDVSFTVIFWVLGLRYRVLGGDTQVAKKPKTEDLRPKPALLFSSAFFGDVHDLVLEDKQIRSTLARQANHVPVVVLDPSLEDLTIHQLDRDRLLFFPDCLQEGRFLKGFFRGRRPPALGVGISLWRTERHARIVHKARRIPR